MKRNILSLIFIIFIILACAIPMQVTWHSIPAFQKIAGPNYTIVVAPLKSGPHYVGFMLTIENKSSQMLEVEWNDTHYFHNGKDLGVLIFRGIDPATIQGAIPADRIAAGETFYKEIFPLRTIALLSRTDVPQEGRRGFEPGVLPAGENGIGLSLRLENRKLKEFMTLRLIATKPKN